MSWHGGDYASSGRGFGRPGGNWRGEKPAFDNPLTWSISAGRYFGIDVRVHLIFLIYIVVRLGWAISPDQGQSVPMNLGFTALLLGILFGIVLLHEFGHCIACRRVEGVADEILMWPLGGLAYCAPPQRWSAHFVTAVGGPLVNVVICIVCGLLIGGGTGVWLGGALPHPFSPMSGHVVIDGSLFWTTIYLINWISLLLLLFNLLPLFPLDGGRILQALVWSRTGYVKSMRIAVRTGYVGAILLFVVGAITTNLILCLIAVFGGLTCWHTHRQLQFTEETLGFEYDQYALALEKQQRDEDGKTSKRQQRREEKEAARLEKEAAEIDRILAKIRDEGMGALSGREKRLLERETRRKQGE